MGTTVGGYNLVNSGTPSATQTSYNVGALPSGETLHARTYTEAAGGNYSRYSDISFTVAAGAQAVFTNPPTAPPTSTAPSRSPGHQRRAPKAIT